jgi:hypothetical protein
MDPRIRIRIHTTMSWIRNTDEQDEQDEPDEQDEEDEQ